MFNQTDNPQNMMQMYQQIKANPQAYIQQLNQTNPLAYQQALQIMNCQNPKAAIIQLAQQKGLNPGMLHMLGLR